MSLTEDWWASIFGSNAENFGGGRGGAARKGGCTALTKPLVSLGAETNILVPDVINTVHPARDMSLGVPRPERAYRARGPPE
jgi:hypothetical protein